jgi:hypothetical protein
MSKVGEDFVEPNPPLEKVEPKPTNTSKVGEDFVEPKHE